MAQDQAGFNWQQYAADNPDVLATGYGIGTYNNAADQMWGHYNEANRLGDHRAYTGYESIMEPTLQENFGGAAPAAAPALTPYAHDPKQGIYIGSQGHYLPYLNNTRGDGTGYDPNSRTYARPGDMAGWNEFTEEVAGNDSTAATSQKYYMKNNQGINAPDFQSPGSGWDFNAKHNYSMDYHPDWVNQVSGRIKTGEKEATNVQYTYDAGLDKWVPKVTGKSGWDTNENNRKALMAALAVATAGYGAYAAAGAGAAGLGGAAATEGAGAAALGAEAGASTMTAQQALQAASAMQGITGKSVPGLGIVSALYGGYGALGNLAGDSGSWMDALKLAQSGTKLYGGVNNLMQDDPRAPQMAGGRGGTIGGANSQIPGGAGGGSDMGWLDTLVNMGAAKYSANKNDNYADELRQERARSLAERQPYLDRVGQLSGDAGADQFRQGGTWQAAERVAGNRFTRNAARSGGLANDADEKILMQDHFMKNLEAERGAAREDLRSFDEKSSRDAFMKGLEMDRMKNSPLFAGAAYGQGGGAGTLAGMSPQIIEMLKQIPGGLQYLQSQMPTSTWGSQPGAPGADPNYGLGGMSGEQYDIDPSYYSPQPYDMPSDIGSGGNDISSWLSDGAWDI